MQFNKLTLLIIFHCVIQGNLETAEYRIGGVFTDISQLAAFKAVVDQKNLESVMPFELVTHDFTVSPVDTFKAWLAACTLFEQGVIAIFGPSSSHSSPYIQTICDQKDIPHIETHWDVQEGRSSVVNLHPHPSEIKNFLVYMVRYFGWKRVVLLFEDDESLLKMAPVLELSINYDIGVVMRQLEKDTAGSYRSLFGDLKKAGEVNIMIDCSTEVLEEVLHQVLQIGMMTEKYNYIITNLDLSIVDLTNFQYGGANITGIRMFDPNRSMAKNYEQLILENSDDVTQTTSSKLRLSTALLIDGLNLFYDAITEFGINKTELQNAPALDCDTTTSWRYGNTIANKIKAKLFNGITGPVEFDNEGFRRNFVLEVVELTPDGLSTVGEWYSTTRVFEVNRQYKQEQIDFQKFNPFNRTFTVITSLTPPFSMLTETTTKLVGNDRYEGFCIDVIHELSLMLGFNYTYLIQEDSANGNYDPLTNQWNGIIREIIDGNADFGIADLTITSDREKAVDFTMPFMNLGISILYKKPKPVPPSLFMFMSPFSTRVWIMLGVAYVIVSLVLFIMGRISPSEWTNPYPCIEEPEYLINQFSIRNSLWFTIGALMQQGTEIAPMSISSRTVSGFWWFFVLIMVSSYTATLTAFLTVETLVTPFNDMDELARQNKIKYGAKKDGSTRYFFRDSNVSSHKMAWEYMESNKDVLVLNQDEGVTRVETENYAYLMESTTIEYVTQRHCSLAQVGGLLDDKGYGIAMKRNSPYRNELSRSILKLQESGRLTELKIKWWKEKRGGSTCGKDESGEAIPLDLKHVGGVFFVLFVSSILGCFASLMEFILRIYRKCRVSKTAFMHEFKKEIIFFFQIKQRIKQVSSENVSNEQ